MADTQSKKKSQNERVMHELKYRPWTIALTLLVIASLFPVFESLIQLCLWLLFAASIGACALWFFRGRPDKPKK